MYQAKDSDVVCIITDRTLLESARTCAAKLGLDSRHIYTLENDGSDLSIWQLMGTEELEPIKLSPEQARTIAALRCYSSGTTSLPKVRQSMPYLSLNRETEHILP